MVDLNSQETSPIHSEIVEVENEMDHEPTCDAHNEEVVVMRGLLCPLPTACFLGRLMGDKWYWVKYGIPGKLNI